MNNIQILSNTENLTMSTLEIAELTGKRHADVMRDLRKILSELDLAERKFASSYFDVNNKEQKLYNLDKDLTLTLVSGYNVKLRHAIVKRWSELEFNERKSERISTLPDHSDKIAQLKAQLEQLESLQSLAEQYNSLSALVGSGKTQKQIEDDFVIEHLRTATATDTASVQQALVRKKDTPFAIYKKRGEAREMIAESLNRISQS